MEEALERDWKDAGPHPLERTHRRSWGSQGYFLPLFLSWHRANTPDGGKKLSRTEPMKNKSIIQKHLLQEFNIYNPEPCDTVFNRQCTNTGFLASVLSNGILESSQLLHDIQTV